MLNISTMRYIIPSFRLIFVYEINRYTSFNHQINQLRKQNKSKNEQFN